MDLSRHGTKNRPVEVATGRLDTAVGTRRRKGDCNSATNWMLYAFVILVFSISHVASIAEEDSSSEVGQLVSSVVDKDQVLSRDEEEAKILLDKIEQEVNEVCHDHIMKSWIYATNLTKENANASVCKQI